MSLFESLNCVIDRVGMAVRDVVSEADANISMWKYGDTEITQENLEALDKLNMKLNRGWDYINDCPKDEVMFELLDVGSDIINLVSPNSSEDRKKDAFFKLSGLGTEFLDKLYEFIKTASVETKDDPLVPYSVNIKTGSESKSLDFKIRESKDLFAIKIIHIVEEIEAAKPEDINRLVSIIAAMPGITDFAKKAKSVTVSNYKSEQKPKKDEPIPDPSATKTFTDVLKEMQALVEPVTL